jgi:hypothetical protein
MRSWIDVLRGNLTTVCGRAALCTSSLVILTGVCEVKNSGILRRLRMTAWALCRTFLTRDFHAHAGFGWEAEA